jgi:large subunit ribosomal protein L29
MKASEVHDMNDDMLISHVAETRQEVFNLRFRHATGELENTARLREARRDLARAITVAKQRGLQIENA